MPPSQELQEILRLTKDNNRILRAMRRNAFWGGLIKFILYVLLLVVAPLWLYSTYLAPITDQLLETYQQVSETGGKASAQLNDLQNFINQLKNTISPQE